MATAGHRTLRVTSFLTFLPSMQLPSGCRRYVSLHKKAFPYLLTTHVDDLATRIT